LDIGDFNKMSLMEMSRKKIKKAKAKNELDIADSHKMSLMGMSRKKINEAKAKKEADELFEKELEEYEKSREPKTIETAPIDKLKSVRSASSPSQEASERSEVKAPEKTREKFLGLFEIDEKQPDFMKEMMSVNKSGGHIKKYNMGGSVRGCGKAMRGYGRANYSKKNI